jgi:spore maturation protein CgeB
VKIAVCTSSGGSAAPHVMAGYAQALRGLGHEVSVINMDVYAAGSPQPSHKKLYERLTLTLAARAPELVLFYAVPRGHGFFDEQGVHICETLEIPFVSFFCDDPFVYLQELDPPVRQKLLQSNFYRVFCSDKYYTQELRRFGFDHAHYLPLATDPAIFKAPRGTAGSKRFECDVSFVGSVDASTDALTALRKQRWARFPILSATIDDIIGHAKKPSPDIVIDKLRRIGQDLPWDIYAAFCRTVYEEANTYIRLSTVRALKKCSVKVFGPEGWKGVSPHVLYGGPVDYAKELASAYASARIVLNITSPQMRNAATSRLFDAPAAGGFVLSDYRPVMSELFGDAVDTYDDVAGMRAKIQYYLTHAKERKERSLRMREIVLAKHTWEHRAHDLLQCMAGCHAFS